MTSVGLLFLLACLVSGFELSSGVCGYEACPEPKPGLINVHVVPHTHDDVGWLKTVDQYYYGGRNNFANKAVVYILDSVIPALVKNPERRFIYVEMAFFWRWWNQQNDQMKDTVKQLVNEGRLEFINGGWCMNDEASTHYNSIIDQMTVGHKFLNETFGDCARPRAAWHIDPFGHSREQASIFAQMYMDGFFLGRIDTVDRILRLAGKNMEEIWHADPNLGDAGDIFYDTFFIAYSAPFGLCNDVNCMSPPVQDDPSLFDENVDNRVTNFAFWAQLQAKFYRTTNIMFTMGTDFAWENAHEWFKNLDKLITYVNEKENSTGVHALYSTPTCYLKSLNAANKVWGSKHEDFFPYRDSAHAFWTGYFTSRPALKRYERITNNFLQVCKQMEALGEQYIKPNSEAESEFLKRAMAVAQHHDAVSGTEKQHVADDYALRLHIGTLRCQNLVSDVIRGFTAKTDSQLPPSPQFCTNLNISVCAVTEHAQSISVTMYNPLARNTSTVVNIPVNGAKYQVTDPTGAIQLSQLQDVSAETKRIRGNRGTANKTLMFVAKVPALGYSTYFVKLAPKESNPNIQPLEEQSYFEKRNIHDDNPDDDIIIQNGLVKLTFDGSTGQLASVIDNKSGLSVSINQSFYYYTSSEGDNIDSQASGAYIFRPKDNDPTPLCSGKLMHYEVVQGDISQEVRQQCTPWLSQVIRVCKDTRDVQFEWTVGPIPYKDKVGKEIITRFDTDIKSNATFYTDANGRQLLKRIRNHRDSWIYLSDDPVSGNYYPVNSRIAINDTSSRQLTIMTDRSQGGSSIKDGSVELMVHRRLFHDDSRGVGEPLNETGQFGDGLIIRGSHYLLLTPISEAAREHRTLGERLYMTASPVFTENNVANWSKSYKVSESLLTRELPLNIHMLTLESWNGIDKLLLRLEHQFEKGEDAELSQNTTVSLKGLFVGFDITRADEMTLSANQLKANATRLQWRSLKHPGQTEIPSTPVQLLGDDLDVKLSPFQIRTFILTIKRH